MKPIRQVSVGGENSRPNRIVAYRYLTDEPDPDLVFCRSLLQRTEESFAEVAEKAGLSVGTLYRIHDERVRRPQNVTVAKIAEAFGFKRVWVTRDV